MMKAFCIQRKEQPAACLMVLVKPSDLFAIQFLAGVCCPLSDLKEQFEMLARKKLCCDCRGWFKHNMA